MTDVIGRVRRTGEMNYNAPRGDAYARVRACVPRKFIYLSETPKSKIIPRRLVGDSEAEGEREILDEGYNSIYRVEEIRDQECMQIFLMVIPIGYRHAISREM